jgi:hypothetical protein
MSEMTKITEDNKHVFIKALNNNLAIQEDYNKDFIITDVIPVEGGAEIRTKSSEEKDVLERSKLLEKVFTDCKVDMRIVNVS